MVSKSHGRILACVWLGINTIVLHGVCKLLGQLTTPPQDPLARSTPRMAVPTWYTKLRPRQVHPNPMDSILRDQARYAPKDPCPGVRTRRDMEAAHQPAHCTWRLPSMYHRRTWVVRYLNQCQQQPASAQEAMQAARYPVSPWFAYQRSILKDAVGAAHVRHAVQLLTLHSAMHQYLQCLIGWLFPLQRHYTHHRQRAERFFILCYL